MDDLRISVARRYGAFALDVDLRLPGRGVSVIFGESGCGKTSLLRNVAGLDSKPYGHISVRGEVWLDSETEVCLAAHKRPLGYVFQEAALFSHQTVRENLAYGMKRSGIFKKDSDWENMMELLDLGELLDRRPKSLSGGEQQRVAIARAILTRPRLLLMDEPLASLDGPRKQEIIPYLERLHQELEIPVLYVTHAPEEVIRLADYIVWMQRGCVRAAGPFHDLLPEMATLPGFGEGAGTVISGVIIRHIPEDGVSEIRFDGGRLWLPLANRSIGQKLRCRISPADVSLSLQRPEATSALNILPGRIVGFENPEGSPGVLVRLALGASSICALITRKSLRDLDLRVGQDVFAVIKAKSFDRGD